MSYLKDHPINENWIMQGMDSAGVQFADFFAKDLAEGNQNTVALTTSQLRKFFGAVKSLQMKVELKGFQMSEFIMLKPKLAYAVGRVKQNNKNKTLKISDFSDAISAAIDMVVRCPKETRTTAFRNFISFFEAIVAYHKVYGTDN